MKAVQVIGLAMGLLATYSFSQNAVPPVGKPPMRVSPGLRVTEYPRHAKQANDDEQFYLPTDQFGQSIGRSFNVKSLSHWKWNGERNAVANGFLKIETDGDYSFSSNCFYDRNMLLVDGKVVCGFRDGEKTIATVHLKKGLVAIASVGFVASRGDTEGIVVNWKPPGQLEMSEIPPKVLCH